MPLKRLIQVPVLFLLIILPVSAQYVPGVNWKKIENKHILLIFPEELTETALELADTIDRVYEMESLDYNSGRNTRWPLILTNTDMISNGYVYMPPRKSEWSGTPASEGLSTLDWYELLGLHETRHMVQMDALNRRFIRFLYYIGGEMAQTGGIHLSIPRWFLEGDAVLAETAYSKSGRGRDPQFFEQLKVMTLDGEYSYQQFVNRSYKTYYPNRYSFGYVMTAYIRSEYGEEGWNSILKTAATVPLPAFGLYLGAKRVTGKSWSRLFLDMMEDLRQQWESEIESLELREDRSILKEVPREYSRYEVLFSDDNKVIAVKYSLAEPSQLIQIQNGEEEVIRRFQSFAGASTNGRQVVWTYNRPSMLYESRNWSDLLSYDLESGRKKTLTRKSRILFPEFSPEGSRLAAVYWSESGKGSIQILDPSTAVVLGDYPLPETGFPSSPVWSEDEKTIYFLHQNKMGRGIYSLDLERGEFGIVRSHGQETIKNLCYWNQYLIYASNKGGLENIMALELESHDQYQLTFRALGAGAPYIGKGEDRLYYSDTRGINGSVPVVLKLEPENWKTIDEPGEERNVSYPYLEGGPWTIHSLKDNEELPGNESQTDNTVEDYSIIGSAFNIHSWGISPNLETLTGLRLNVQSANVMGTFNWSAGGEYEINEKTWGAFLDMDWRRFYPVIGLRNSADLRTLSGIDFFDVSNKILFSFPMNLRRDLWNIFINPGLSSGIRTFQPVNGENPSYYFPVNAAMIAYAVLPGSSRAVYPDWGLFERLGNSIDPSNPGGIYHYYTNSVFYTPGFFRNTGFRFGIAYEKQSGNYSLSFPFARGYDSGIADRTAKFSADYDFPMAYPDSGAGSFFYIRRIRGNLFYDFLIQNNTAEDSLYFRSYGSEITFDFTAANQEQGEFNLGFRFLWLQDEKKPAFQLVLMNASFL